MPAEWGPKGTLSFALALDEFLECVQESWGVDTLFKRNGTNDYRPDQVEMFNQNPAMGQCDVTALVVQDYYGGQIVRADDGRAHWFNITEKGLVIDLTINQFADDDRDYGPGELVDRERLLDMCGERYEILAERVKHAIAKRGLVKINAREQYGPEA
jgi:hypothetical protein